MQNSEMITVGRAYGTAEAALAMSMLEAYGIKVLPPSWYHMSVNWHLTHALGGIELRVPAAQTGDALEILAGFQVTSRPKSLLRRLFVASIALIVLVLTNFPPPPSGFFVAALRRVPPRSSAPATNPS